VGNTNPVALDIRIIAATNRDLRGEVNRGRFRSDLFYRLNVVTLKVPPLRDRREDIPLLVAHFYEEFRGPGARPPADLVAALVDKEWPGNVRELRSAVERMLLLGELTPAEDGPSGAEPEWTTGGQSLDPNIPFRAAKERIVGAWEKWYVSELLRRYGSISRAAREVKMDRHHLGELLRRYGVSGRQG
jgi:DNA-binding NtrC family response regulator